MPKTNDMMITMCLAFVSIRYQIISRYLLVTRKQPHFPKNDCVEIEIKDERSLSRFLDDLQDADIINKLDQNTLSDPNKNYDKFIGIVVSPNAKNLPTRRVKFNRRKHRIQMWVTKGNSADLKTISNKPGRL